MRAMLGCRYRRSPRARRDPEEKRPEAGSRGDVLTRFMRQNAKKLKPKGGVR